MPSALHSTNRNHSGTNINGTLNVNNKKTLLSFARLVIYSLFRE